MPCQNLEIAGDDWMLNKKAFESPQELDPEALARRAEPNLGLTPQRSNGPLVCVKQETPKTVFSWFVNSQCLFKKGQRDQG